MKVRELIERLDLKVCAGENEIDREITGGYVSDLLSDVMGFAEEGQAWITLQTHKNIIAVASLKDLAAIIIVSDRQPDNDTIEAAEQEGVPLLISSERTFELAGKIYTALHSKERAD